MSLLTSTHQLLRGIGEYDKIEDAEHRFVTEVTLKGVFIGDIDMHTGKKWNRFISHVV